MELLRRSKEEFALGIEKSYREKLAKIEALQNSQVN